MDRDTKWNKLNRYHFRIRKKGINMVKNKKIKYYKSSGNLFILYINSILIQMRFAVNGYLKNMG